MSDLRKQLQEGDPCQSDRGLSAAEVESMWRLVSGESNHVIESAWRIPGRLIVALLVGGAIGIGVLMGHRQSPSIAQTEAPPATEQRQLQFETPGGTRIMWVLNPTLEL